MTLDSSDSGLTTMTILQESVHLTGLTKKSQQCIERLRAHNAETTDLCVYCQ